jgi:hypothetical protein
MTQTEHQRRRAKGLKGSREIPRFDADFELREVADGGTVRMTGYAAVYGNE